MRAIFLAFAIILLVPGMVYAVNCNSCSDCTNKINAASSGTTVFLTTNISSNSGTACIYFSSVNGVSFNCQGHGIQGFWQGVGIKVFNGGMNTISNCVVDSFMTDIDVSMSDSVSVKNCHAWGSKNYGISVDQSGQAKVTSNDLRANAMGGISVGQSTYVVLMGNTATGNVGNGIIIGQTSDYTSLSNNVVSFNTGNGISVIQSSHVTLSNNNVHENMKRGIEISQSSDSTTLTGNTVWCNKDDGIRIVQASSLTVKNNAVYNNNVDYVALGGGAGMDLHSSSITSMSGNKVTGNWKGIDISLTSGAGMSSNCVCQNGWYAISKDGGSALTGGSNTCNNPNGWNDAGVTGCKIACTGWCNNPNPVCFPMPTTTTSTTTTTTHPPTTTTSTSTTTSTTLGCHRDVLFQYSVVDDNGIKNCSLWTNTSGTWKIDQISTSVNNNNINPFLLNNVAGGVYRWVVQCFDTANHGVNASNAQPKNYWVLKVSCTGSTTSSTSTTTTTTHPPTTTTTTTTHPPTTTTTTTHPPSSTTTTAKPTTTTTTTTTSTTSTTTVPHGPCWNAGAKYLYIKAGDLDKFCKCVSGVYGDLFYDLTSDFGPITPCVYPSEYVDKSDDYIWTLRQDTNCRPAVVYVVLCPDNRYYYTDQSYSYPPVSHSVFGHGKRCWSASFGYLRQGTDGGGQSGEQKFCKCAMGTYGVQGAHFYDDLSQAPTPLYPTLTSYAYCDDTNDLEWMTTEYIKQEHQALDKVLCPDSKWYPTNANYFAP